MGNTLWVSKLRQRLAYLFPLRSTPQITHFSASSAPLDSLPGGEDLAFLPEFSEPLVTVFSSGCVAANTHSLSELGK